MFLRTFIRLSSIIIALGLSNGANAENLIENGDFHLGSDNGTQIPAWQIHARAGNEIQRVCTTGTTSACKLSIRLDPSSGPTGLSQTISLEPIHEGNVRIELAVSQIEGDSGTVALLLNDATAKPRSIIMKTQTLKTGETSVLSAFGWLSSDVHKVDLTVAVRGSGRVEVNKISVESSLNETSPEATQHVEYVLNLAKTRSLYRDQIDWDAVRERVLRRASGAKNAIETYQALNFLLHEELHDNHSFFLFQDLTAHSEKAAATQPESRLLDDKIGYIKVPGFASMNAEDDSAFATHIQTAIADLDRQSVAAWIVDLRGNDGGNMWPMVAGLGQLYGDDKIGSFVRPNSPTEYWTYSKGAAFANGTRMSWVTSTPTKLKKTNAPLVVLQDEKTASSGEAVLVAFRGRRDTLFIGRTTAGFTSANELHKLPDGTRLLLAEAWLADRTGRTYTQPIAPDVLVQPSTPGSGSTDAALNQAIEWVKQQRSGGAK